jgi:hypothetical protein
MLKRYLFTVVVAGSFATAVSAQIGQSPTAGAPRPSTTPQGTVADRPATITLTGCLQRERDVPGRSANAAEQAGVLEDYLLTNAAADNAAAPGTTASTSAAGQGAVGTSGAAGATPSGAPAAGAAATFKVEGLDDERLRNLVGRRVEVTGRIDNDDAREASPTGTAGIAGDPAPTVPRATADDVPEFEATSIREVAGECRQ